MESLWKDLRFSARALLKRPGFTAVAVITIAVGIAANTAIFSVVNAVLLEPLPVEEPAELVVPDVIGPTGFSISLSIPNFRDWSQNSRTFQSWGANAGRWRSLTGEDRPEMIRIRLVLGEFFRTLGASAAVGRTFGGDETWEGAEPVAVVTHAFWEHRLALDPKVLGRSITLDGQPFTIIGVMPPEFVFPSVDTEVFVPMGFFSEQMCWNDRGCSQGTWAIARLAPAVRLAAAQEDMDRVTREISETEGEQQATARLEPLREAYVGDVQAQIWILMGAVVFVLLIACANVASLLLARGEGRRQELALRMALGAGGPRIVRQLLTESLVLSVAGGAAGIALAFVAVRVMTPRLPDAIPSVMQGRIGIDPAVLLFALAITLLAAVLFGIAPALRGSRRDLTGELKEGRRGTAGRARQRLRSSLVVAEVALALVLLIGAGLMIQSLSQLQQVEKGFVAENVLTARIPLPLAKYTEKEQAWPFYNELHERLEALPDVEAVSLSNIVPLQGNSWEQAIVPEGVAFDAENFHSVLFHMVMPGHFETLGIELLRGRTFDDSDRDESTLVAVIDETMAEKFWPGDDPIGKRVVFETEGDSHLTDTPIPIYRTVVGVVRNVRHYELENPSRIQIYVPFNQSRGAWARQAWVLAKTREDPLALTNLVRREVSALDPDVPVYAVQTMKGYVDEALAGSRSTGFMLALFSAVALLLSGIGIFGVMSFSVVQRMREIGIRMALGASSRDVLQMVSRHGLLLGVAGIVLGLIGALALTRVLAGLLYQVDPVEPGTYAGFAAFLLAIALLASYLPARRATRVDPAVVLREE